LHVGAVYTPDSADVRVRPEVLEDGLTALEVRVDACLDLDELHVRSKLRILQRVVENDELLAPERVCQVLNQRWVGLHPSAPLRVLDAGEERSDLHVFEVAVFDLVQVVPLRHVQLASRTLVVLEVSSSSGALDLDRKSTRLNSSHVKISYA